MQKSFFFQNKYDRFEQLLEHAKGWDLDFIQLDHGPFSAGLLHLGDNEFQFGSVYFNKLIHQRGTTPGWGYTFGIYQRYSTPHRWLGQYCPPNGILTFPNSRELESISQPGFRKFVLTIDIPLLERVASDLGLPEVSTFLQKGQISICSPRKITKIQSELQRLMEMSSAVGELSIDKVLIDERKWALSAGILSTIASARNLIPKTKLIERKKITDKVIDYMVANVGNPISIAGLCRYSNCTDRTLRNIFYEVFGKPPVQYLKCMRLEMVRKTLLDPEMAGMSITDIANANGFWHMGQFAKDYRSLFDELPSITRKDIFLS